MAIETPIEWTDASWTPVRARYADPSATRVGWHCEHVSEGCRHCYAETLNRRIGTGRDYKPAEHQGGAVHVFLDDKMLLQPLKWRRPRRIFVCSMTDLFASFVPDTWIDKVFAVMALCPHHTFQVLTKRPERMRAYFAGESPFVRLHHEAAADIEGKIAAAFRDHGNIYSLYLDAQWPLPNVWLGTSVENQATADERIPHLLQTPAAVRFLSCEPLLRSVDLSPFVHSGKRSHRSWKEFTWPSWVPISVCREIEDFWRHEWGRGPSAWLRSSIANGHPTLGTVGHHKQLRDGEPTIEGRFVHAWNNIGRVVDAQGQVHCVSAGKWQPNPYLDWVIVGGESGAGARPMHPDWARALRDQCQAAGVPFFFKQWGEFLPCITDHDGERMVCYPEDGGDEGRLDDFPGRPVVTLADQEMWRVGKRHAGRRLDGRTWDEMPEPRDAG